MSTGPRPLRRRDIAAIVAATAVGLALAARWDLLADEAYHWTWSLRPAFGYYDQPPLVAWVLAAERAVLGDSPLSLRLVPVLAPAVAFALLLRHAGDRLLAFALLFGLPPLAFLTKLAIPDALLLACWAGSLAAALGRAWVLAGILAGLAGLAKYTGLLLFPLLACAAVREERGQALRGLALGAALLVPNVWWNATHGWQTVMFQLGEGLLHEHPPGLLGPARQIAEQVLVAGPLVAVAGAWWAIRPPGGRTPRVVWWTSVPVFGLFAVAAVGGPPEAHWPAPAWIGAAIGLSHTTGGLRQLARAGAVVAVVVTALLIVHVERPLVAVEHDPAARFAEGRVLRETLGEVATPVLTERYQEAALLAWHGIEAGVLPGCGRPVEGSDQPFDPPPRALFLRPTRSGPPVCAAARYAVVRERRMLRGADDAGRAVGPWDVFEVER